MGRTFVDRWGAPVDAGNEEGVALFDEVVESLAALAGDPVAGAQAVVGADDDLVLGHIFQAYLALYSAVRGRHHHRRSHPSGFGNSRTPSERTRDPSPPRRQVLGRGAVGGSERAGWSAHCCTTLVIS